MKFILIHKSSVTIHVLTIPYNHLNYMMKQLFKHRAQTESEVLGTTVIWRGTGDGKGCGFVVVSGFVVHRWVTLSKLFQLSGPWCFNL